jgi:hypothetical protein
MTTYTALFNLGKCVATPYAKEELERLNYSPLNLLRKHMSGDWSEMAEEDQQSNREAITEGSRIFSAYTIQGTKFWVIRIQSKITSRFDYLAPMA